MILDPKILPPLAEHDDYRKYLRSVYEKLKATNADFSFRFFARRAGFASPNFLKLVMDGKRNLSDASARSVAAALKLGGRDTKLFLLLVQLAQSPPGPTREKLARDLLKIQAVRRARPLAAAQFELYSEWYVLPIRELVATPDFDPDPRWIAARLFPPVTPDQAAHALDVLRKLDLVRKNPSTGKLEQTSSVLTTGDRIASAAVARWHRQWIEKAATSIERFSADVREVSSFTAALTPEGRERARKTLQRFRKELWAIAETDEKRANAEKTEQEIYQIGFQLFPVSRRPHHKRTTKDET